MKFSFVVRATVPLVFSRKLLIRKPALPVVAARSIQLSVFQAIPATPDWGSKKFKTKKKLQVLSYMMADPKMEEILAPLRASVKEQVIIKSC